MPAEFKHLHNDDDDEGGLIKTSRSRRCLAFNPLVSDISLALERPARTEDVTPD